MKGLLYKELKLNLSTILVYGGVQLVLVFAILLLPFIAENDEDMLAIFGMLGTTAIICSFLVYFLITMMPLTTFSSDASHAWQNFSAASPSGPAGQVGAKYLILLSCNAGAFVIHALLYVALSLITDTDFYYLILVDLVLLSGGIILSSAELPFYFAFGFEKGQSIKTASLMVVIFLALAYLLFGDISFFKSPNPLAVLLAMMTSSAALFVPIAVVLLSLPLFCLSMMLSIKLFPIGLDNLEQ